MTNASSLEYALLGLIKQSPQSGYDLRKTFATTPMRHFSDSPGSIYPALRRLESRGWIISEMEKGNARKRQEFRITKAGKLSLVHWLSQPITRDDVVWGLEELILRFAFLDGNVERSATIRFLQEYERELQSYTKELREYKKTFGAEIRGTTGVLAFENGLEAYESKISWARRSLKIIMETHL